MNTTRELAEAGASATAKVVSQRGFHRLSTIRDTLGTTLLPKLAAFEETVQDLGWSPENGFFKEEPKGASKGGAAARTSGSQVLEETSCAKCGAPAIRKGGMRKDKTWWEGLFCSTGDETHKVWLK
jgi:hypothetical protein